MCKVINLFGEPGAGKSALAAYIFYRLKILGYNCELCTEFAKSMVYEKNEMALSNQSYIFGNQMQKMGRLKDNVDIIITDSPLLLCGLCVKESSMANNFFNLVFDYFNTYNNYNYLLKRDHKYVKDGRLQDEKGAQKIRDELVASLIHYKIPYTELVSTANPNQMINPAGEYIISEVIKDIKPYEGFDSYNKEKIIIKPSIKDIFNSLHIIRGTKKLWKKIMNTYDPDIC